MNIIQPLFQSSVRATVILKTAAILALMFGGLVGLAEAQIYVDADADGANDGTSWGDAYNNLQDALANASSGDQIRVAEGIYIPVTPDDPEDVTEAERQATFQLKDGVEILGGFPPGGGPLSSRDWKSYPTILSGDIEGNDTTIDGVVTDPDDIIGANSYHVVTSSDGITLTARLDGFTITGGNADDGNDSTTTINDKGGGMLLYFSATSQNSPTLTNLTFSGNRAVSTGGGLSIQGSPDPSISPTNPTLTNVTFIGNWAGSFGGGMYNYVNAPSLRNINFIRNIAQISGGGMDQVGGSQPVHMTNVVFRANTAGLNGGGMNFEQCGSANTLTNVIFDSNMSEQIGGGMSILSCHPILTNITFVGNLAETDGGGLYISETLLFDVGPSFPTLKNVILWGNQANRNGDEIFNWEGSTPTISHSLIRGGCPDDATCSEVIDTNPNFVDPDDPDGLDDIFGTADDGLRLQPTSLAVNTGTNTPYDPGGVAEDVTTDLAGADRIYAGAADPGKVDMGAYELQEEPAYPQPDENNILYVNDNVVGGDGTGSSWSNAVRELRDALTWANALWNGEEDGTLQIWMAGGTYTPVSPEDPGNVTEQERRASFRLPGNVQIYGGFTGNPGTGGDELSDRDWATYETILSGEINEDNSPDGNSYNVVTTRGAGENVRIDGVTITGGNANGEDPYDSGGGMNNQDSSPTVANTIFTGNSAIKGGAISNTNSSPVLRNVSVTDNSAEENGGGMYQESGDASIVNSTIAGNTPNAIYTSGADTWKNTIVYGGVEGDSYTASNSLVEGDSNTSDGNIDATEVSATEVFADPGNGDYSLLSSSPAINASSNSAYTDAGGDLAGDLDLAGNPRVYDGESDIIDMGAWEFQGNVDAIQTIYVDHNATGGENNGTSWGNAFLELQDGLDAANGNDQVWVAEGSYTPSGTEENSFTLSGVQDGVKVYGGFASGDGFADRNPDDHPVILSGDLEGNDTTSDGITQTTGDIQGSNSSHVLILDGATGDGITISTLLDGFTVTGGQAGSENGGGLLCDGSAGRCSPTLNRMVFVGNSASNGGAISNEAFALDLSNPSASSPIIINSIFTGNSAEFEGGAMYNEGFTGSASANSISSPTIINSTFTGNSAGTGGAIYSVEGDGAISTPELINLIVWGNTADNDPQIGDGSGVSPTISHSLIEGNTSTADGNINATGLAAADIFADPAGGIYSLLASSPAINAGSNQLYNDANGDLQNDLDLAGNTRVYDVTDGGIIDIGAYEFQGEPETPIVLTMREGWRMLSSPIAGQSYAGMLAPLWTQGVDGADYSGGDPNVYTWNIGYSGDCITEYELGEECEGWQVPSSDAFAEAITPGTGFLVYVFADDDYDGDPEGFEKDLTLTGIRHNGEVSPAMNENEGGWTLVGNPYGQPVAFSKLDKNGLTDAAYVYDPNLDLSPDDPGPVNGNGGAWRSIAGLYGDIPSGNIAPGQGFFVQTTEGAADPTLRFSESDQTGEGEFYGKKKELRDFVRLEMQGESLYNSAWVRFSGEGSLESTDREALELQPLSASYALLGARKTDGTLMDIAHFPLNAQDLEIPLAAEATQSGEFTIRATDLDLPAGMALYLYDRQTGESMHITDDSFEYSFTIDKQAIENSSPSADGGAKGGVPLAQNATPQQILAAGAIGPSKATTTGKDRFVLTTTPGGPASELPDEVALGQNYPNPFNPTTQISYQLPQQSQVRLEVYDMLGRRVATLVDEQVAAGTHQVNFDASRLSSGVYLYRLQTAEAVFTRKLTLIK